MSGIEIAQYRGDLSGTMEVKGSFSVTTWGGPIKQKGGDRYGDNSLEANWKGTKFFASRDG
jgi:hypothetical protein